VKWCLGFRDDGGLWSFSCSAAGVACVFWAAAPGCVERVVERVSSTLSLVYRSWIILRYLDLPGYMLPA